MSDPASASEAARAALLAGRYEEAVAGYQALIAESPQANELYLELSSALAGQGRLDEAALLVDQLLPLTQGALRDEAHLQWAAFRIRQNRGPEAVSMLMPLLDGSVRDRAALALSGLWNEMGFPARAADLIQRHAALCASAEGLQNLIVALSDQARGGEILRHIELACERGLLTPYLLSNALMTLTYLDGVEPAAARLRAEIPRVFGSAASRPAREIRDGTRMGSLRVGMVSADLYRHPVGYFLSAFLHELVRHCWVALYYNGSRQDSVTRELGHAAHRMADVGGLSDEGLVDLIRSDDIDVLLDLSGHTGRHRLQVFARRAAPVQVSFLGYFASTHLPEMDVVIMDAVHVGEGEGDPKQFSERVYRLPCSRFCYRPPEFPVNVAPLPCLGNQRVTFGSFSNTAKMSPRCIALWAAVLKAVPESRLQLRWKTFKDRTVRRTIWQMFRTHGVAQDRVELYPDVHHDELFEHYQEVDIALDTVPFSGATTSCEALWGGVPVVTLRGRTAVSRQSASVLEAIGLGRLVANSEQEFVDIARSLTNDVPALARLRENLREMMTKSGLMDARRYARHLAQVLYAIAEDHS